MVTDVTRGMFCKLLRRTLPELYTEILPRGDEFRVWKKEVGGGGSSIVSGGCYTCYHSGMQNANSQAKIFSDCTNDL